MKYGIFSDVHSNLEAFEAVLEDLKKEKVDSYCFVGDIVGYGANPKECIQLLRGLCGKPSCACVAGNHDYAVCGLSKTDNYNPYAKKAIDWTKLALDKPDIQFLAQLKLVQRMENFTMVHATLTAPQEWGYIFDIDDAYPNFKVLKDQLCFIGHSHRPVIFTNGEAVDCFIGEKIVLQKGVRYIINIGSVGQPRDGDVRPSYAVYDTDSGIVEIKRSIYDIKKAQEKIITAGLPEILAERLSIGR